MKIFDVTSPIIEIFLTQFRAKFGCTTVMNFLSWSRINLVLNIILENKNQSQTALLVGSRLLCLACSSNNLYAAVELLHLVWSLAVSQGNYISRKDLAIQITFYLLNEVKLLTWLSGFVLALIGQHGQPSSGARTLDSSLDESSLFRWNLTLCCFGYRVDKAENKQKCKIVTC